MTVCAGGNKRLSVRKIPLIIKLIRLSDSKQDFLLGDVPELYCGRWSGLKRKGNKKCTFINNQFHEIWY